jgi:hypothetical protein
MGPASGLTRPQEWPSPFQGFGGPLPGMQRRPNGQVVFTRVLRAYPETRGDVMELPGLKGD